MLRFKDFLSLYISKDRQPPSCGGRRSYANHYIEGTIVTPGTFTLYSQDVITSLTSTTSPDQSKIVLYVGTKTGELLKVKHNFHCTEPFSIIGVISETITL